MPNRTPSTLVVTSLLALCIALCLASCIDPETPTDSDDAGAAGGDGSTDSDGSSEESEAGETDAGEEPTDAGEPPTDAGEPSTDAGAEMDAATDDASATDAGSDLDSASEIDAGSVGDGGMDSAAELDAAAENDASSQPDDSSIEDAASSGQDAASSNEDAFTPSDDAGIENDAGTAGGSGRPCGGPDGIACDADELCNTGMPLGTLDVEFESCLGPNAWGKCIRRPSEDECSTTPQISVCGCDGFWHPSACEAHARGILVRKDRRCAVPARACGMDEFNPDGQLYSPCNDPNNICVSSTCFPGLSIFGRCEPVSGSCPDVEEPVCSCGKVTYRNACLARQAGAAAVTPGACPTVHPPRSCHVPFYIGVDLGCFDNQYCNTAADCTSGSRPRAGMCQDIPSSCPDTDAPVCGCNRVTYANECEAHRAHASIASQGPCP